MNEQGKNSQPKIYERISPGSRFCMIANDILEIFGSEEDQQTTAAIWHENDGYDEYSLMRYDNQETEHIIYRLTHNDKRYISDSWTRYVVIVTGQNITNIMLVNDKRLIMPLDEQLQRDTSRQALKILTQKAPNCAEMAMQTVVDKAFPQTAANFILSDFADEENGQIFTEETARRAVLGHRAWINMAQNDEMATAEAQPSDEDYPQPEHMKKVGLAASTTPSSDNRHSFITVQLMEEVLDLAADMNYDWGYTVSRDTDSYLAITEKRGDHE